MATLASQYPTLADIAKQTDPDGGASQIIEMLSQEYDMVDDIPWLPGNKITSHITTVRTKLPEVYLRAINQPVRISKSASAQIEEDMALIEAVSDIDTALMEINGNSAQFRANEDAAFREAMMQTFQEYLLYGRGGKDSTAFNGFTVRYNAKAADNEEQIIDAGGTGADNTSVWLVVWGPNSCHGIYAKNGVAGLEMRDAGEIEKNGVDLEGFETAIRVMRTRFKWNVGLAVRDYRQIVRIANIDTSDLVAGGAGAANLIRLMTQAMERVYSLNMGRPAFYCNRAVREALRLQMVDKVANSTLTMGDAFGRRVMMADTVPVRLVDKISNNEARVV